MLLFLQFVCVYYSGTLHFRFCGRLVYFPFSPGQRSLSSGVDVFISLSLPVSADRAAQWFILYKRTKEVRGSIPTEVVFPFFSGKGKKKHTQLEEKGPYRRKTRR